MERRLAWGLANPDRYTRHVERHLPFERRTGRIPRRDTCPPGTEVSPAHEIDAAEAAAPKGPTIPRRPQMTVTQFLADAAVAYDAAFENLRPLTPLEKLRRRADTRHGGMLDMPFDDPEAFLEWFHSGQWVGAHPWEIVFGHPHGIHLFVNHFEDEGPVGLHPQRLHRGAVHGRRPNGHGVGRGRGALRVPGIGEGDHRTPGGGRGGGEPVLPGDSLEELREVRPDSVAKVTWQPIPRLARVTPDQVERIRAAEAPRQ